MNANELREMKNQIKEMQSIVDGVSNEAAREMFETIERTGQAYTGEELSLLTENILSPSQASSAIRAIIRLNPYNQCHGDYEYDAGNGKQTYRRSRNRNHRPTTKFTSARDFAHMDVRINRVTRKTFSIACDETGFPLVNAVPKSKEEMVTTYQLESTAPKFKEQDIAVYPPENNQDLASPNLGW